MRFRQRMYKICIMLYGCFLFFSAILFTSTIRHLSQHEPETNIFYRDFPYDVKQSQVNTIGIITLQSTSLDLVHKNSSSNKNNIVRKMESIELNVPYKRNNKTLSKLVNTGNYSTLRRWNNSHPLVFLHIGKTGGTSFDKVMAPIISKLHGRYVGYRHFDWSYIDNIKKPDVVVLLRDPVSRAVSHFHFSKTRYYLQLKSLELKNYLQNPQVMLETRDIWQDGQAAVLWLTGTHIANWVGIKPHQVSEREIESLNEKILCRKAAERLRQTLCLWFGVLSDPERSFEMLQWQLGYSEKIKLPKHNSNPHPNITIKEEQILESLMPMDMWLYKYAISLFEARWTHYKTGFYDEPELPQVPEINCKSTRFILACNRKSPIGPIYHVWNTSHESTQQQMELLPKENWMH